MYDEYHHGKLGVSFFKLHLGEAVIFCPRGDFRLNFVKTMVESFEAELTRKLAEFQ
jgi:hypothetical protein